jgi:hypothetical protein
MINENLVPPFEDSNNEKNILKSRDEEKKRQK